ncbi:protein-glutamate O-methyltransferase [Desulfobacterales bacterium HSG17]|nr:protein-glutamate O-methyltransferase [Desulfobacterales bacterium HSG17]
MQPLKFSEKEYSMFRDLVYNECGINLSNDKKELLRARLGKRLRQNGMSDFRQYYKYLTEEDSGDELTLMLDCVSTNLTRFFREKKHFEFLSSDVLPAIIAESNGSRKLNIRVWSAGCSSGEEPYSLAFWLLSQIGDAYQADIKILASDISTRMLDLAQKGVYQVSKTDQIPLAMHRQYLQKGVGQWEGYLRVKPEIRRLIQFKRVNLMDAFSIPETFDFIFCRNVMIYFDRLCQENLINKFHTCLKNGGYLFVGHSESLTGLKQSYKYVRPAIYQKIKGGTA